MSAVMTVSLDGYLDPQRLSFGSPPGSEIVLQQGPCSEESFPVFSPLPPSVIIFFFIHSNIRLNTLMIIRMQMNKVHKHQQ